MESEGRDALAAGPVDFWRFGSEKWDAGCLGLVSVDRCERGEGSQTRDYPLYSGSEEREGARNLRIPCSTRAGGPCLIFERVGERWALMDGHTAIVLTGAKKMTDPESRFICGGGHAAERSFCFLSSLGSCLSRLWMLDVGEAAEGGLCW